MKKKKKEINGKFVPLTLVMLKSEAWRQLSDRAVMLWTEMTMEFIRLKYNPKKDENQFAFSYGKVKERMSDKSFYRARKELVKGGFFDVVRHGGLEHKHTLFKVSSKWKSISILIKEKKDRKAQSEHDKTRNKTKVKVEKSNSSEFIDELID
ncbi:hypothetical protein ES703_23498 [subsurface metagenome]